jgi:uncharacterized protein
MQPVGPFVISLAEIPPEGLVRTLDLSGEFARIALAETEADAATAKLEATLQLTKQAPDMYVQGTLRGDLTLLCSRCLGPAAVRVDAPISVLFVPRGREDDEIDPQAPDVIPYDGDEIDVGEMLREEMLLALPMVPLCSESCLGLCPTCGKDLNEGPCGHAPPPRGGENLKPSPRWAALQNVRVKE